MLRASAPPQHLLAHLLACTSLLVTRHPKSGSRATVAGDARTGADGHVGTRILVVEDDWFAGMDMDAALEDLRETHDAWVENVEVLRRVPTTELSPLGEITYLDALTSQDAVAITEIVDTIREAYRRAWERVQSVLGEMQ